MDYHYEIFKNVGEGHCPGCDTDGFFCLLEETLWVSSTLENKLTVVATGRGG